MALLMSRTFNAVAGRTYISMTGTGIGLNRIVCVKREGTQYDKVLNASINDGVTRQWALDAINQRIKFPTAIPFNSGEKVFVIYKTVAL